MYKIIKSNSYIGHVRNVGFYNRLPGFTLTTLHVIFLIICVINR